MKKTINIAMLIAIMTAESSVSAQTIVKGHVVNERGESIEYVSIGFENDSVGVISDAKGHFELTIPAGRKTELSFSHVSYFTTEIPYEEYARSGELTVVLKDKIVELAEVVIGKKNKPKTIVGKGIPAPGLVGTSGHGSDLGPEGGVPFSCKPSEANLRDHHQRKEQVHLRYPPRGEHRAKTQDRLLCQHPRGGWLWR